MGDINIGTGGSKISESEISVKTGGEVPESSEESASTVSRFNLNSEAGQAATQNFIDKYLVPIYDRSGIVPVIVLVTIFLAFVLLAFYMGVGVYILEFLK